MSKTREYIIRVLPEPNECIQKDTRKKGFWKIKGYTFPNIPLKFSIRQRAAVFAKSKFISRRTSPTYVVLYADEERMECLFIFRYHHDPDDFLSICRCVGKFKAKYHWKNVRSLINANKNDILSLKEMEYKKIPIF